ncbi:NAD(P)/FAD-dependent oxidoreductase [Cellulomonas aerilata]|uniref:Thioredoxin reductase n=1 Tax=Cellulomonas aerilata TaxID=515326 RepID=A0A512D7B4_9CELL|nr:NAD(P)/FAD-dependent oxidoreductase [Cellulomonas aerilata]GEO32372.1 thioredoxin reductase [Cellulomonas aerilata]
MTTTADVLIIGAGPAGLSAALVLGRARRDVVVVDSGRPRNAAATTMYGYLSRDGLPPEDLLAIGREEVARYGVRLVPGEVARVRRDGEDLVAEVPDVGDLRARRVLLATGLHDAPPTLDGVAERWGRDVLHCPYCHGYEVRDRPVAVLGRGPVSVHYAQVVRQWSPHVLLLRHTLDALTDEDLEQLAARDIDVVDGEVSRIVTEGERLVGVELVDGTVVPCDVVFVGAATGTRTHDGLLRELGAAFVDGPVTDLPEIDPSGRTSVAGVWAAGNVTDPTAQVVVAAGQGYQAGVAINTDLIEEDVATAVAARRLAYARPA